jgi:hypothetical protein
MCVDYTSLNKGCLKDPFALPRIDQVIDLTTPVEADQSTTMFITPFGCFCCVKMPFRLNNVVATYQRCMQFCFKG